MGWNGYSGEDEADMDGNMGRGQKKNRYIILDDVRGLILVSMVIYHAVWNMVNLFGARWHWYHSAWAYLWQQSICWGFILLSGFCWPFGKQKWKRGLVVSASGLLVSAVTVLFMPENAIWFGVLTCLGSCMLLMPLLHSRLRACSPQAGSLVSFGLFVLFRNINAGTLGFEGLRLMELPKAWYADWFTAYLGFPPEDFYSADYFSLFPWLFLFLTGYFIGRTAQQKEWLSARRTSAKGGAEAALGWLGKHSLLIYLIHQPLLYAIQCVCCQ